MLLGGLQKTTLIDFPGKIACTVFTVGCNFACPFCHNKNLVTLELFKKSGIQPIKEKEFFQFLQKRKKILDGVCITGGEPCLHPDLPEFIKKIKKLGYLVKLDTNGSNPKMLERLIKKGIIDFVAMDVKSDFDSYQNLTKFKMQNAKCPPAKDWHCRAGKMTIKNSKLIEDIKQSIKIILESGLSYEFRTTVVPGLHTKESLVKLAKELKDLVVKGQKSKVKGIWYLQQFRPQNCLDPEFLKIKPYTEKEMKGILRAVQKILPKTRLRRM